MVYPRKTSLAESRVRSRFWNKKSGVQFLFLVVIDKIY